MTSQKEQPRIYVGKTREYTTINAALDFAKMKKPSSEQERIVIYVDPGDYEEQVKISGVSYLTIARTPGEAGRVNLHWYYCTGYCYSNVNPQGNYDPDLDWTAEGTFAGLKSYTLGQSLEGVEAISYYDLHGNLHENENVASRHLGSTRFFNQMAALIVDSDATEIIIEDLNIVNSVPVMVTQGEKDAHITPQEDRENLPGRKNLAVCDEETREEAMEISSSAEGDSFTGLSAEQSAYLVRSSFYNERGHAISLGGDRIVLRNVRARGNQDTIYITSGRCYFENCDLIGGTDYIYGNATAVFNHCKLGAAGMSNKPHGATITAANTEESNPYGYLFYHCTLYNTRDNITVPSCFGRPWRGHAQVTFYETIIDDISSIGKSPAGISPKGWNNMSVNTAEMARFYEYGTENLSGKVVDTSERLVNVAAGIGSVLTAGQAADFQPRNYLQGTDGWDPMNCDCQN